ncbi:MAG TPA: GNAT family N-acetyltransferase [Solirubrobacteraceae bacterium]|nr:GNAT family N-acetyltransferase [Solirubrobacteraceae bacterium]
MASPIVRDVILRDGSVLRLRSPRPDDEPAIKAFFDGLTPESRYMRFHGHGRTDIVAHDYANADGDTRVALLAHLGDRVVAVAGYDRLNEPGVAEVAFAVADDLHGRGLATRMLEQLADVGGDHGVRRFDAEVMAENRAMLGVFSSAGFDVRRQSAFGEAHVELDIRPSERLAERIAARDHRATVASLRAVLHPGSVAVIGASARADSVGGELLRRVVAGGFAGVAAPVSRGGGVVASMRAVPSTADLPEPPELAIVAVPADEVVDAVVEAVDRGARGVLVVSAGFSDTDEPEGREREEALLEAVRARGARLVGPNSLGLVVTDPDVALHGVLGDVEVRPGGLALSSQSGALGLALLAHAAARRLGIAAFISLGNRADVSTNDLLEYWADDPRCQVLALYVESFGNPRRFAEISRRVSRLKPILAVKGNRGRLPASAASHTAGALGDEAAADALLRQAGVLRVESTEALFDAAELLERQPLPRGRRVGIVTNSGGLGRIATDACTTRRLELAIPAAETVARLAERLPRADRIKNPVDLGVRAPLQDYLDAVAALLEDDGVDAVIAVHAGRSGLERADGLEALERATAGARKPIVACAVGADGRLPERARWTVPNYRFPEAAVRALGLAADRRDWLSKPLGVRPAFDDVDPERAEALAAALLAERGPGWLDVGATAELLATHGLRVLPVERVAAGEVAVAAAERIGGPVALKADFAPPARAGDIDAVLLGLEGGAAVRAGWEELERRVLAAGREWSGARVQPLAGPGADVLVGAVADSDLGPVVGVGMGGRQAGLAGDVAFGLAPLNDVEVDGLLSRSPGVQAWLEGLRGAAPLDRPALRELVLRFSLLLEHVPELAEVDLNPVRVMPAGATIIDARVRLAPRPEPRRAKTW